MKLLNSDFNDPKEDNNKNKLNIVSDFKKILKGIVFFLLSILAPPIVVIIIGTPGQFAVNLLLTILGWIPGVIHALMIVNNSFKNQTTSKSNKNKDDNYSKKSTTKKNDMTEKKEEEIFFGEKDYEKILDEHFELSSKIKENYKKRNNEKNYRKAINACKKQIRIADRVMEAFKKKYIDDLKKTYIFYEDEYTLEEYIEKEKKDHPFDPVSHRGYKQLSIIKHKNGEYEEVIKLCKKAKNQGWRGDWDKRIKRAEKKLNS